jgi:hypothetical protein
MNADTRPDRSPYEMLGGDASLRRLVDRFYGLMDEVPEYHGIRRLHPQDLAGSREKLHLFLSGWLGWPPLYVEKNSATRLRAVSRAPACGRRTAGSRRVAAATGATIASGVASRRVPAPPFGDHVARAAPAFAPAFRHRH